MIQVTVKCGTEDDVCMVVNALRVHRTVGRTCKDVEEKIEQFIGEHLTGTGMGKGMLRDDLRRTLEPLRKLARGC